MANDYILEVGQQGKSRLGLLNEILNPLSQRFLNHAGLSEGMHVLEAGCGIGIMTTWLAQRVGPQGRVTALDNSQEQIAVARETIEAAGLTNVEFVCSSIEGADLEAHINSEVYADIQYSTFLKMAQIAALK